MHSHPFSVALALMTFTIAVSSVQSPAQSPTTVSRVDLDRYVGTWYEISKIPNSFQKKCVGGTTAEYRKRDDGTIEVINSCRTADGDRSTANGLARVVDKNTNSKLEVSFVSLFGWHLFWGDYWIIGLEPNYAYAVIGTPDRKYGWVLSRTATLSEQQGAEVRNILLSNGYNPGDFESTPQ